MIRKGQIINVQAYKQNGHLYRQWNGVKVLEVNPEYYVLFLFKTKVSQDFDQNWVVREPIIWWMPKEQFFNTTGLIRKSGTHYYTNLASPPVFEDNTLKYIDYDLDIKLHPNKKYRLIDVGEFNKHKVEFNYSDELIKKVEETTDYVISMIEGEEVFFNEEFMQSYILDLVEMKFLPKKMIKELSW